MRRYQRRIATIWGGRLPCTATPASILPSRGISTSPHDGRSGATSSTTTTATLLSSSAWMGMSTPFHRVAQQQQPLSRQDIDLLAAMPLTHAVPSRVTDHVCIRLVRMLRWIADRLFRERLVHRALVLKCIASSPAAAGLVVEHIRCTLSPSGQRQEVLCPSVAPPSDAAAADVPVSTAALPRMLPSSDVRRVLSNLAECQQAHMRMVLDLARLSLLERLALLVAQCVHFVAFGVVFALSRRTGFRLMGYLLEESSVMFTHMINDLDMEKVPMDAHNPGPAALRYWGLDRQFATADPSSAAQHPHQSHDQHPAQDQDTPAQVEPQQSRSAADADANSESAPDEARPLLSLRDVTLLMRADDMTYRDLVHAVATHMDVVRDQAASGGAPPTAFR